MRTSNAAKHDIREALSLYARLPSAESPSIALCRQQLLRVLVSFNEWSAPATIADVAVGESGVQAPSAHMVALPAQPLTGATGSLLLLCSSPSVLERALPPLTAAAAEGGAVLPEVGSATVAGASAISDFLTRADPSNGAAVAFDTGSESCSGGVVMDGEMASLLGLWSRSLLLEHELECWRQVGSADDEVLPPDLASAFMSCPQMHVVRTQGAIVGVPTGELLVLTSPDVASPNVAKYHAENAEVVGVSPGTLLKMVEGAQLPGLALTLGPDMAEGEEPKLVMTLLPAAALIRAGKDWMRLGQEMAEAAARTPPPA